MTAQEKKIFSMKSCNKLSDITHLRIDYAIYMRFY